MRELLRRIGMDITFYAALAILYPTTKALELGSRAYAVACTHMKKERT